jgi:oligoribonuclease NrnB/cAMP/cGMP phosphodiesterase (DHH superfamily)
MRVKLFTHTDLDGIGCAVLAYLAFGKENVDVEYCNYDDIDDKVEVFMEDCDLYRSYNQIFITDISVSDSVANMIDILDRVDRRVQLFDHHGTALFLNKYDWCNVTDLSPLHDCKTSGTELFYVELMNHGYFSVNNDIKYRINVDKFVMNVRDYDTWRWKELGEFGIVCKQLNDLFYIYGRDEFVEWTIKRINMFVEPSPMFTFPYFDQTDVALLNQKHQDIDIYVEEKNKQIKKFTDQWGNSYGVVFAERYFSELGNQLCEMNPDLAYVAMIDISNGRVSYRSIRDNINLGTEIAHNYGGGGHPKAAGSTFDSTRAMETVTGWLFGDENSENIL